MDAEILRIISIIAEAKAEAEGKSKEEIEQIKNSIRKRLLMAC